MRIALIGSRGIPASYSGFETFYEQLAIRLVQRGHEVTVYNRNHHFKNMERIHSYHGVNIRWVPSIPRKHLDTITHAMLSMILALWEGFDIYYVCIAGNSPVCLLARLMGGKTVLNVDGRDAEREKWAGWAKTYIRWAERLACRVSDIIIADSMVISKRYMEEFDRETVFIPYGAVPRPREPEAENRGVLKRFDLEPEEYILFVSRLTPENRAHLLIEAFNKAKTNLKLVIVGDAPYQDRYKKTLRDMLGENIRMTGYLFGDEYRQISRHCLFFVMPSRIDGTRPVLLDQMAFGNCVLVNGTPANLEVIGDAGLSFDPANEVESLAEMIGNLGADRQRIEHYRVKALERARSCYSWEKIIDRYEELFFSLTGAKESGTPERSVS